MSLKLNGQDGAQIVHKVVRIDSAAAGASDRTAVQVRALLALLVSGGAK